MSAAVSLPTPVLFHAAPARVRARPDPRVASTSRYVYGDSTPFPEAVDFVATTRAVVRCGVALMKAQHAIDCARGRVGDAQEHLVRLNADLGEMARAVDGALVTASPRPGRPREAADRISTMTRGIVGAELRVAQAELDAAVARADRTVAESRKEAALALGDLLARHDLPGASVGFRVFASGEGYDAETVVTLPCGLRATFDSALPAGHPWTELRRVRDAREAVLVTMPRPVGWLRKQVKPVTLRLDAMVVLGASIEGNRGALLLGKSARSGVLHAFDVDLAARRARWRNADESEVVDLGASDAAGLVALLRAIEQQTRELRTGRRAMTEATLDGSPIGLRDPADPCGRVVSLIAPVVRGDRPPLRRAGGAGPAAQRRLGAPGRGVRHDRGAARARGDAAALAAPGLRPARPAGRAPQPARTRAVARHVRGDQRLRDPVGGLTYRYWSMARHRGTSIPNAPVAQLDRAVAFEATGRRFESVRACWIDWAFLAALG